MADQTQTTFVDPYNGGGPFDGIAKIGFTAGDALYDQIMRTIEPELVRDQIPLLTNQSGQYPAGSPVPTTKKGKKSYGSVQ